MTTDKSAPVAQTLRVGQSLPARLPVEHPQIVISVERVDDRITRIKTDQTHVYNVPHFHPMGMPCRLDGSIKDWRKIDQIPRPEQLAFGDTLKDPWDPTRYHVVYSMRRYGTADSYEIVIETMDYGPRGRDQVCNSRATIGQPFEPKKREILVSVTAESRIEKPWRGPYTCATRPGVVYWFAVHPTGKGRWPDGIDPYKAMMTPGEYRSRPLGQKKADTERWKELEFAGTDDSDRHPYDPYVLQRKRSSAWQAWALAHREDIG